MKGLTIAASIMLLMAVLSLGFSVLAQPSHIPHENPLTAEIPPSDPISLLIFYTNLLDQITAREYQDAQRTVEQASRANIHPQLRDTMDSFNRLANQLAITLNNLESLLHDASSLFSQHQISEARQKLDDAEETVQSARFLLEDIEATTNTLEARLEVFPAGHYQRASRYFYRLQNALDRLRRLIEELNHLRESITEEAKTVVTTSFHHPTLLEVSAPENAHPGLPITIDGRVSSTGGIVDRTIRVLLGNAQLAEEIIRGQFTLQVTLPPQISMGKHSLTLVAVPGEHYTGATTTLPVYISSIPIQTEIQVPQTIILPKPVQISGSVHHDLVPLQDARVELNFKGYSSIVKTAADGSFTTSVEAPPDLSLLGPQELTILIEPAEPWYAPLEVKRWILPINPISSGLILVALISLGIMLYSRVRISLPRPQRNGLTVKARLLKPFTSAPVPGHKPEPADIKGRIFSAYVAGLRVIERVTGISMAPHTTIREYLYTTTPQLPEAVKPFSELSTITENALYSAQELDENTAASAERLADIILQEPSDGTA